MMSICSVHEARVEINFSRNAASVVRQRQPCSHGNLMSTQRALFDLLFYELFSRKDSKSSAAFAPHLMVALLMEADSAGQNALEQGCARCHERQGTLNVRNEHLCKHCFLNYVGVKVSKRLESNNLRRSLRDEPKNLLVALSLGPSSLAMLHVLDQNAQRQCQRTGRAGYKLHVLFIDPPSHGHDKDAGDDTFTLLKETYAGHTYLRRPLEDVLDEISSDFLHTFQTSGLVSGTDGNKQGASPKSVRFEMMLAKMASDGSTGDVVNVLRDRLIASVASKNNIDAILYGDSTTRLAEKTLSEAARGRGAFIPWVTADGPLPHGPLVIYPMRDLFRKELITYTELVGESLRSLVQGTELFGVAPASSKGFSIDRLMQQYFTAVEENYPSVVSNVVRTSTKLEAPQVEADLQLCSFCNLPVLEEEGPRHHQTVEKLLCYGCRRMIIEPG